MSAGRDHRELSELLGAWALDAVEDAERAEIEAHLATCARCRAEAEEHLAVAAALGNTAAQPPAGLWERIAASLDDTPPPLALEPRHRRLPRRLVVGLAAAAVVLFAGLGYLLVDQQRQIDRLQAALLDDALARAASVALADPDSRRAVLRSEDGTVQVPVVIDATGTGYLLADRLPPLPEGRTYQLWGVSADTVVSLGVLGPEPRLVAFRATIAIDALALTDEAAPGVAVSEQPPLAVAELPV